MKNRNIRMLFHGVFIGFLNLSCESHEQNADAFELIKKQKMSKDTIQLTEPVEEITEESIDPVLVKSTENNVVKNTSSLVKSDEWTTFNFATIHKIKVNEITISEIKVAPNTTNKLLKKVIEFEKENNSLAREIEIYKQEEKLRWAAFKSKINQEAIEISVGLKDLKISNK